jgi:hypothetical protein
MMEFPGMAEVLRQLSGWVRSNFYSKREHVRTRDGTRWHDLPLRTNANGYVDPTFYDLSAFTGSAQFVDNVFTLVDNGDTSKKFQLQLSGISAATTRTWTVPDGSDTFVGLTLTQTLTNKTLTTPTIGDFTNAAHNHSNAAGGGTVSHASLSSIGTNTHAQVDTHIAATEAHGATGAVVGTTNVQTLTDKTLTSPVINTPTLTVNDNALTVQDGGDTTKKMQFQLSGITASNTRTLTVPDSDGTLALLGLAQTFSALKTFSAGLTFGNETLANYDEGTWSPAINGSSSDPTVTFTIQVGIFTRIGNVYIYVMTLAINTISGGGGDVRITLPVTILSTVGSSPAAPVRTDGIDLPGTPSTVVVTPLAGAAYANLRVVNDNATSTLVQVSALAAGDVISASGIFFV